jgi:hypothetical protein
VLISYLAEELCLSHGAIRRYLQIFHGLKINTGDEVANFGYVDVAKMQNLFFTVVAAVAYTVALVSALSAGPIAQVIAFPDPTAGLVALIGISHAGYLADHAVVHSVPTAPPEEPI